MELFTYYMVSSICLIVAYGAYRVLYSKKTAYAQARLFILAAIVFSLVLPLSHISYEINLALAKTEQLTNIGLTREQNIEDGQPINQAEVLVPDQEITKRGREVPLKRALFSATLLVSLLLICRLVFHVFKVVRIYVLGQRIPKDGYVLILSDKVKGEYSFFNWIFLPQDKRGEEVEIILAHEKTHASQLHSADILFIELLAAVMWFNPIVWLFRKELQALHEYLADEGVLGTGIDRLRYQALLLNQICEERLICLSSSFNHSLIKKRMIMMTKQKFNPKAKLRTLMLIPLAALLFFVVGCINGQQADDEKEKMYNEQEVATSGTADDQVVASIAATKMNVVYLGVENPITIAVSGYKPSELDVTCSNNGKLTGSNGLYKLYPRRPGIMYLTVTHKGELIQKKEFRVKLIPDPVVTIAGKKGGVISKDKILDQKGLIAEMENFDFDLNFKVTEFTMSIPGNGSVQELKSNSDKFTREQKESLFFLEPGRKVYFESIKLIGPDGTIREVPSIALLIE